MIYEFIKKSQPLFSKDVKLDVNNCDLLKKCDKNLVSNIQFESDQDKSKEKSKIKILKLKKKKMTSNKFLIVIYTVTAGDHYELGSDEQEIVLFAYLVLDIINLKVRDLVK